MSPAVEEIDSHSWLGKAEAAKLLGVSPRQIERLATKGTIRKRTLPRAQGEATARVVYSRADLDALKAGEPNHTPPAEVEAQSQALAPAMSGADPVAAFLARLMSGASVALPAPRAWLTLEEAAEVSGLTRRWLLEQAEAGAGTITVRDMGRGSHGGRWRFLRSSLEQA